MQMRKSKRLPEVKTRNEGTSAMDIVKGTRHQKIIAGCGELTICNWLSRSGFEVAIIDHTGIDIIAYNPSTRQRLGITIKSRTRIPGRETVAVNIFSRRRRKNDREKALAACKAFACEPWLGVYVETTDRADIYLTSLSNYDTRYRRKGRVIQDWKMGSEHQRNYASDPLVKHIKIKFEEANWSWEDYATVPRRRQRECLLDSRKAARG